LELRWIGSITGTAASNYTLTQPTGLVATINKANVTISGLSVADKVYDTFNTAVISGSPTVIGLLGTDTADITSGAATATFAQSHVGNNLPITVVTSDLILNNDKLPNYWGSESTNSEHYTCSYHCKRS
jgi:mucin-19